MVDERQKAIATLMTDPLTFTRYFFKKQNKAEFVVGRHHRVICDALKEVLKCNPEYKRLIINIAPRFGKTELAVKNFIAQGLAINPRSQFIHLSYSSSLVEGNSDAIKDIVNLPEYQAAFPNTRIKRGSNAKGWWSTTEGGGVYATSTLGQITGFGAGLVPDGENAKAEFGGAIVIDDPIKPEDALSDIEREKVNRRFETTIRSRLNSRDTPIIIIMQRLHERDLCGYLQAIEPDEWKVISLPAIEKNEEGQDESLWPFKFSIEELHKLERVNSFVFRTQYMQEATPLEGLMYTHLRTYSELPAETIHGKRKNYTDTADTGADNLCSIDYIETPTAMYIIDVIYTSKPMEDTEPMTARMLTKDYIDEAYVESNNGGRGFARNVEKQCRLLGNKTTAIHWFTQAKNKEVRIFSHSAEVQNLIYFPAGWEYLWPQFYEAIVGHRKEGRNAHDDAPDVLTGMVEKFEGNLYNDQLSPAEEQELEDIIY